MTITLFIHMPMLKGIYRFRDGRIAWHRPVPKNPLRGAKRLAVLGAILATVALILSIYTVSEAIGGRQSVPVGREAITPQEEPEAQPAIKQEAKMTPSRPAVVREITAYTASPSETDSTPCISADGTDICQAVQSFEYCAANFVPLGTELLIGGDIMATCRVVDRMNSRYKNRVDVLFTNLIEARAFGLHRAPVSILE